MSKKYSKNELENMANLISDYTSKNECNEEHMGNNMNCISCDCIEDCYIKANNRCNSEFAESINYGGYDSAEEFWEQLFD